MAIAFDVASQTVGSGATLSWSHTTTGSDRILIVGAVIAQSLASTATATYNGVSMTQVSGVGANNRRWWYLVNPATGSNTVSISFPSGTASSWGVAASYTGVNQSTPFTGLQVDNTNTATPSVVVTSTTGAVVIGGVQIGNDPVGTTTVGAGQTSRVNNTSGSSSLVISDEPGATSVTHSYTHSVTPSFDTAIWAASFQASSSGTAPSITSQPSNTTVAAGATANFSVTATGTGTLTYQWQRSTDSGASWNNVTTGTGGTTASYTTAATTVSGGNANNGDQYRVIVTGDTSPPATSTAATLTVTSGAPDAPNTLARTLNPGSVDLTWVLPGTGATRTGVRVERRNVTAAGAYSTLASLGASAVNYSDTTALGGILWRYRVIAFNGSGDSGPSNEVDANYTTGGGSTGGGNLFGGTLVRS